MTDQSSLRRAPTRLPLTQADVDELMELRRDANFGNVREENIDTAGSSKKPKSSKADKQRDARRGRSAAQRLGVEEEI